MDIRLSDAERVFIIHGIQEGLRNDGRSCGDYRPMWVERGVLATTDGSSRVRIGDTDILCGVKCELVECEDSSKETERLVFSVDCSANATPQFIGKGGDDYAEELEDALHLAYDNECAIPDLAKLTLTSTHFWRLYVDVVILQYGGAVVDAASVAAKAALFETEIVKLVTRAADEKKMAIDLPEGGDTWRMDVKSAPLISSITKIGLTNVVDVTHEEETCSFAALWVGASVQKSGTEPLVTMTRQAGGGSLDAASINEMIQMGVNAVARLDAQLMERLALEKNTVPGQTFLS
ncbi:hypothetical protein PENTCL1PPCAC_24991 [Pristionchus entomophagus]|uniref:Ribosomal RNA-processing protein 42 n=1 Tax=Pristionchus entomophagus TaxID=358040 RepID=A0AAV5U8T8_9BILA|nr:hypothetical protein PENTCL1PPCAC_24991 [Pristionchus entomophagus]